MSIEFGVGLDAKRSPHLISFSPARDGWFTCCGDRPATETAMGTAIPCEQCLQIAQDIQQGTDMIDQDRPGWLQTWSDDDIVIVPLDDHIIHEVHGGASCPCGPTPETLSEVTTMWAHHSLDGREARE